MLCRIFFDRRIGGTPATPSLIDEYDPVCFWIKKAAIVRGTPIAGAAMKKHCGYSVGISALFYIDPVERRHLKHSRHVRLDIRIQRTEFCHFPLPTRV